MILFNHFVPLAQTYENGHLAYRQGLALQSVVDSISFHSLENVVSAYTSTFPFAKVETPEGIEQTYSYSTSLTGKRIYGATTLLPYLQDVLDIMHDHGTAEYIILSNPDVCIRPNFYEFLEYYLKFGHDALAIQSSVLFLSSSADLNKFSLRSLIWGPTGIGSNFDVFVFKREILHKFIVEHAYACLPSSSDILIANLLSYSSRLKVLTDEPMACRFNNWKLFDDTRFDEYTVQTTAERERVCNKLFFNEKQKTHPQWHVIQHKIQSTTSSKHVANSLTFIENSHDVKLREVPQNLPGTIWGIGTYFNPDNNELIRENFDKFAKDVKDQGLPLLMMELVFRGQKPSLNESNVDKLVIINDGDIMWQKEKLFNLALQYLPEDCDKVVLLDCDVKFLDDYWIDKTAKLLESFMFVQPYSHIVRLQKDQQILSVQDCEVGWHDGQVIHGLAHGVRLFGKKALSKYPFHGSVGMALAVRRRVLEKHGIYDADIVGSGDLLTVDSIFKTENIRTETMNSKLKSHFDAWQKKFYADCHYSFSGIEGAVCHHWHGSSTSRFYVDRYKLLEDNDFDPYKDITLSNQGVWKWNSDKKSLHIGSENYFKVRDDG